MTTPIMTIMIAAVRKAARGVQRDFGEAIGRQNGRIPRQSPAEQHRLQHLLAYRQERRTR